MNSSNWFLNEIASVFSNLPIALYALGFHVQDGLISAICNKSSAPMPFVGSVVDLKTIWNVKQTDLFGILGTGEKFHVASLRHGNTFPLVNKAVLAAAGCIDKPTPVAMDLTQPRAITVNITFCIPRESDKGLQERIKFVVILVGYIELCAYICSATVQALKAMFLGSALAACLASCTLFYLLLQHFVTPVYAHQESVKSDLRRTVQNGAATDIHVIVSDWNSDEMYVLLGYTSYLHAITNAPARASRPFLLLWICRGLGITLCVQAALLAKLIQAAPPALYGSPIWLLSALATCLVHIGMNKLVSRVQLPASDTIELFHASQVVLPARRTALAFIASLPISPPRAGKWEWVDPFIPDNARRQQWQQEMEIANLASRVEPKVNFSDDGRRIVSQIRAVRFSTQLVELISQYEQRVGMTGNQ